MLAAPKFLPQWVGVTGSGAGFSLSPLSGGFFLRFVPRPSPSVALVAGDFGELLDGEHAWVVMFSSTGGLFLWFILHLSLSVALVAGDVGELFVLLDVEHAWVVMFSSTALSAEASNTSFLPLVVRSGVRFFLCLLSGGLFLLFVPRPSASVALVVGGFGELFVRLDGAHAWVKMFSSTASSAEDSDTTFSLPLVVRGMEWGYWNVAPVVIRFIW